MHNLKSIRERLGVTQQVLAEGIGCTQGNVGHYERGQTLLPEVAARLIAFAASRGLRIGYDHVYGDAPLPRLEEVERAHA
jgi:putative transcriptional regulator